MKHRTSPIKDNVDDLYWWKGNTFCLVNIWVAQIFYNHMEFRMDNTNAASSKMFPPSNPILRTLQTDLCALEVEAIKLSDRKANRISKWVCCEQLRIWRFDVFYLRNIIIAYHIWSYLYDRNSCRDKIGEGKGQLGLRGGNASSYKTDRPPNLCIVDSNPMLINFCKTLEGAFRHGAIHEDKRNKFELIDLLLHISRKQNSGK